MAFSLWLEWTMSGWIGFTIQLMVMKKSHTFDFLKNSRYAFLFDLIRKS